MTQEKIELLQEELTGLQRAVGYLGYFMERCLNLIDQEGWLEARNLHNRLVHEYMTDPAKFIEVLALAKEYSLMLIEPFNRLRQDAMMRMGYKRESLPEELVLPGLLRDQ